MTAQEQDAPEGTGEVPDFTRGVSRRRVLRRGALGAGLAVAGGALLAPRAAEAADGDPVLASQTNSSLTGETGLSGACSPSVLRLAQSSTTGDGLIVNVTDTGAAGTAVKANHAGTGTAISAAATGTGVAVNAAASGGGAALNASASGSSTASAITASATASLPANHGVIEATNNSTTGATYAVKAVASGAGGAVLASAATAPAVSAQSSGSAAALFAKNTGSGPGVSVTTTNTGAALLLTSGGTAILASTQFNGSPAGVADKAGISITTQSSTGAYVKASAGRAIYAENTGGNDTIFATNTGTTGKPRAVTGYLQNPTGAGSAIYGLTAGTGAGIEGKSNQGRGGQFTGRAAQVRLLPSTGAHPSSGAAGDLFVDNHGNLWFCKGGTNWKQIV